ncbi:MAG: chorismate synthase, partial [Planctomycetota bacterium]
MSLRFMTAGESHGPGMLAVVEGLPAGLEVDLNFINAELRRRQAGYGRGARQRIETDTAEPITGVMQGRTMGGPVVLRIPNRDSRLDDAAKTPPVHQPRPGHADLAGSVKWLTTDCRTTLERASARETAARVAAGALARCMLRPFGIESFAFVRSSLDVRCTAEVTPANWKGLREARDASEVGMPCAASSQQLIDRIHQAKVDKDTVGGLVEAHV